ncbi:MAG TPA: TonB-dependent receptor [Steroidobacteraceae bacterium]
MSWIPRRRTLRVLACLFAGWALVPSATAGEGVTGRPVAEILREAAGPGVQVVFSDELVPPDLLALVEPTAKEPVARLREILRPHDLALVELAPGRYVVARRDSAPGPGSARSRPIPTAVAPIEEVRVISSRYTLAAERLDRPFELDSADLRQQPALFDDALRGVRRFPGTAGSGLSSRTFVRGGVSDENLLLLDGVQLQDPFHLAGLPADFSVIDPAVLGRIDFYSGVLPVEYGNRMSSAIDMHTRGGADAFGGRLALGTVNASALLEGPLPEGHGDWLVFVRRGLIDVAAHYLDPDFGQPVLTDSLGRVRFHLGEDAVITLGGLGADDDLQLSVNDGDETTSAENDRSYAWGALDQSWARTQARTLLAHTSASVSRHGDLQDGAGSLGSVDDNRKLESTVLKQDWSTRLADEGSLRWGVSLRRDEAEYDYQRLVTFPADVAALFDRSTLSQYALATDVRLEQIDAYIGLRKVLSSRWTVDGGARWSQADYSTSQHESAWDARLGLLYSFSPATRIRLSWGRMTQFWGAAELPVERNRALFDPASTSDMRVLAWEHDFASGLSLRTELFDKRTGDPRSRTENIVDPIALVPELRADEMLIDPDLGRTTGFDVHAAGPIGDHVQASLSYSWSHARDTIDGREFARSWDQRHSLTLGLGMERGNWLLSMLLTARSDWPMTPVAEIATSPGVQIGERNSEREEFFLTVDLKAERSFRLEVGSLHVALELANALNRENFCCTELDYGRAPSGELAVTAERKNWLPIVPYASVAWEF